MAKTISTLEMRRRYSEAKKEAPDLTPDYFTQVMLDNGYEISDTTPLQKAVEMTSTMANGTLGVVGKLSELAGDFIHEGAKLVSPAGTAVIDDWLANRQKVSKEMESQAEYSASGGNTLSALFAESGAMANQMMPRHTGDVLLQAAQLGGGYDAKNILPEIAPEEVETLAKSIAKKHPYLNNFLNLTGSFDAKGLATRQAEDIASAESLFKTSTEGGKQAVKNLSDAAKNLNIVDKAQPELPMALPSEIRAGVKDITPFGEEIQEDLLANELSAKSKTTAMREKLLEEARKAPNSASPELADAAYDAIAEIKDKVTQTGDAKVLEILQRYAPLRKNGTRLLSKNQSVPRQLADMIQDKSDIMRIARSMPLDSKGDRLPAAIRLMKFAEGTEEVPGALEAEIDRVSDEFSPVFNDERGVYNEEYKKYLDNFRNKYILEIKNASPDKVFATGIKTEAHNIALQNAMAGNYEYVRQEHINRLWNQMAKSDDPVAFLNDVEKDREGFLNSALTPENHAQLRNAAEYMKQNRDAEKLAASSKSELDRLTEPQKRAGEDGKPVRVPKQRASDPNLERIGFLDRVQLGLATGASLGTGVGAYFGHPGVGAGLGALATLAGEFAPELLLPKVPAASRALRAVAPGSLGALSALESESQLKRRNDGTKK